MSLFLQIYFIISSLLLLFFSLGRKENTYFSFSYALAINIIPLFWMKYHSMDYARFLGIPLGYLPIISAGLALIIKSHFKIKKHLQPLVLVMFLFISYTFITTLILHPFTIKNFNYWFAWILNFSLFIAAATFFSKVNEEIAQKVIKSTVFILIIGCFIGLLRYFTNISYDANFMPVVNRNGTVVFIVLITPLLFYLYRYKMISRKFFIFSLISIFFTLLFIFSRSGFIGFLVSILLYYMKFSIKNLIKIFLIILSVFIIFQTGLFNYMMHRLERTAVTIEMLYKGEELNSSMGDYKRVMLLINSIEIIKHNFLFGTGLGLENYRMAFHKISDYPYAAKAHNFYLSYLAELGMVGYTILLIIFIMIYKNLAPMNSKYRAFRVTFWVMAIMMAMNEYILLPELWFYFGMLAGISYNYRKEKKCNTLI